MKDLIISFALTFGVSFFFNVLLFRIFKFKPEDGNNLIVFVISSLAEHMALYSSMYYFLYIFPAAVIIKAFVCVRFLKNSKGYDRLRAAAYSLTSSLAVIPLFIIIRIYYIYKTDFPTG